MNVRHSKTFEAFVNNTYTYRGSSDPRGLVSSFKTLDLVADQSLAANSTYASNFERENKIYKEKSATDFFGRPPKIN